MDKISVVDLKVFAHHGVFPEENEVGQFFFVSAEISIDLLRVGMKDELYATINYGEICHMINKFMTENVFKLIETCCDRLAREILLMDSRIKSVTVTIKKPSAPIGLPLNYPVAEVTRARHEAYIAVGSNQGDSKAIIEKAVERLGEYDDIWIDRISELFVTKPYGVENQPDFLNGMLKITTLCTPQQLLERIHTVEAEAGRERVVRWGPRTLDLDIIFYDDLIMEDDELCIPHADMQNRDFVLKPLVQIARYKVHPLYRKRVIDMYEELMAKGER